MAIEMKLRQIAIAFLLIMLAVMIWIGVQIEYEDGNTIDMVYYNGEVKEIAAEIAKIRGETENQIIIDDETKNQKERITEGILEIEEIEEKHSCVILFRTDEDYQSRLSRYIEEESIILDYSAGDTVLGKIIWQTKQNRYEKLRNKIKWEIWGICILILVLVYGILLLLYFDYIRPFRVLQEFTSQVSKGNLELALPVRKNNFFGAFTESFDLMRQELKRAKESEYQANISKKELIAQLSHDIKTPLATIKATCEVIQVVETNPGTLDKAGIIASKAEMIDNLIGNMFHATLEELEVLKVEAVEESSLCIPQMFNDFRYYGEVTLENEIPECLLYFDKLRLQQVLDNILNNAYKYAETEVRVSFLESREGVTIQVKDFGDGIADEEMAFICQKFYRGSNTKGKSGSGLGLYLAKNFMIQMGGEMECYYQDGFVVSLFLRKV